MVTPEVQEVELSTPVVLVCVACEVRWTAFGSVLLECPSWHGKFSRGGLPAEVIRVS